MALLKIGPSISPNAAASREMQLAQLLINSRKPVRHWSDGLSNAVNTIAGTYLGKKAAASMEAAQRNKQNALASALMKAIGRGGQQPAQVMMAGAGQPTASAPPYPPDGGMPAPATKPVVGPYPADAPLSVVKAEAKNDMDMAKYGDGPADRARELADISPEAGGNTAADRPGGGVGAGKSGIMDMAIGLMKNPDTFEMGYSLAMQDLMNRQKAQQEAARQQSEFGMRKELEQYKYQTDPRKQWMTIPGLGVFNVQTGELKTPYGSTATGAGSVAPGGQQQGEQNALAMLSPRGREQIAIDAAKSSRKQLEKLSKETAAMQKMAEMADQFDKLLDVQGTGGVLLNLPGAETVSKALGDKELSTMYAITNFLTPLMRQGLPGAASDRDVAIFRGATISPDKPVETNRMIARGLIEAAKNKRQELEFKSDYLRKHGNLDGADALWQRYLDDNRIFVGDPGNGLTLNPSRRTWQEYFGSQGGGLRQKGGMPEPSIAPPPVQENDGATPPPPPGFRVMGQ